MDTRVILMPPRNLFDRRVVGWWRMRLLLLTAVVAAPLGGVAVLVDQPRPWLAGAAALAAAGIVPALVLPVMWYRTGRWEVTEDAVYTRSGALVTSWRIAPLSRIQTVDTTRGPLQHRFGLATVVVTTASAAGSLRIAGLPQQEANELSHRLSVAAPLMSADAT